MKKRTLLKVIFLFLTYLSQGSHFYLLADDSQSANQSSSVQVLLRETVSQKPVVLRNENDYQWARSLDLNGTTLWSSSLYEMQKLVFGPERVIISKIDLRDPLYLKEDDNFSYHVRDDGILTIEYENKEENENKESKHFNITEFAYKYLNQTLEKKGKITNSTSVGNKTNSLISDHYVSFQSSTIYQSSFYAKSANDIGSTLHTEPSKYIYDIVLIDGSSAQLIINGGSDNGELADHFLISDLSGNKLSQFTDLNDLIDYLEDIQKYADHCEPPAVWIKLKNQPVIDDLYKYLWDNAPTHYFFFDEISMRAHYENTAFYTFRDGPISFRVPHGYNVNTIVDYYDWEANPSYLLKNYFTNQSIQLSLSSQPYHSDPKIYGSLEEWTKRQKSQYRYNYPNTFLNEDGQFLTSANNIAASSIVHGYNGSIDLDGFFTSQNLYNFTSQNLYNYSIALDLNPSMGHVAFLKQEDYPIETSSYEDALHIAHSFYFNQNWQPPKYSSLNSLDQEPYEIIFPDPDAAIPLSRRMSQEWYQSTWFGNYFQLPNKWVFRPYLGWLFAKPDHSTLSVWLYGTELGWLWTDVNVYPFFFSDVRQNWIFFCEPDKHFYDYTTQSWKALGGLFETQEIELRNDQLFQDWVIKNF